MMVQYTLHAHSNRLSCSLWAQSYVFNDLTCECWLVELVRVIFQSADIDRYVVRWVYLILDLKVLALELLNGVVNFRSVK